MISKSYGSVLGISIKKKLKVKVSIFFVQIKKIRHFKSPNIWPPFFQSDVFCILCICSRETKVYRGEDKPLEMNQKEGGSFWCAHEGGSLKNWQAK